MHTRARILYERIIYNNIYIYELVLSIDGTHGMYRTSLVALRIIMPNQSIHPLKAQSAEQRRREGLCPIWSSAGSGGKRWPLLPAFSVLLYECPAAPLNP